MSKNYNLCSYGLGDEIVNIRKNGVIIARITDNGKNQIQIFIETVESFSIDVIDLEKLSIKIKLKDKHSV